MPNYLVAATLHFIVFVLTIEVNILEYLKLYYMC